MKPKTLLSILLSIALAAAARAQQNNTDTSDRDYGVRYHRVPGMPGSAAFFKELMDTTYSRPLALRINDTTTVLIYKDRPPVKPAKPAACMETPRPGFCQWAWQQYYFDLRVYTAYKKLIKHNRL